MELQYRWSKSDLEAYAEMLAEELWEQRKKILTVIRWSFGIVLSLVAVFLFAMREWLWALLFLAGAVYYLFFMAPVSKGNWKRKILKKENASQAKIYCDRKAIFSENGMVLIAEDRTTDLPYASIAAVKDSESTWFLRLNRGDYALIPKSAFHSRDEEQAFLQFLNSKIKH